MTQTHVSFPKKQNISISVAGLVPCSMPSKFYVACKEPLTCMLLYAEREGEKRQALDKRGDPGVPGQTPENRDQRTALRGATSPLSFLAFSSPLCYGDHISSHRLFVSPAWTQEEMFGLRCRKQPFPFSFCCD